MLIDIAGYWRSCLNIAFLLLGILAILALALAAATGFAPLAGQAPIVPVPAGGGQSTRAERNAELTQLGDNFIDGGQATTSVTGPFTLSGQQIQADTLRSYIQGGMAWLGFGALTGGTGAAEILVTLNESGQDTVTVAQGDLAAIGQDDDCEWTVQVSESSVSGTISCAAVDVLRNTTEAAGTASIQLQFSTTLEPMDDGSGGGEGGGNGEPTDEADGG